MHGEREREGKVERGANTPHTLCLWKFRLLVLLIWGWQIKKQKKSEVEIVMLVGSVCVC